MDIAVAFLGEGADALLREAKAGRLLCNLESGATNPAVVRALQEDSPLEVRSLASLHAKAVISERAVRTGSTNLSASGLGLEGEEITRWHEAGIYTRSTPMVADARDWFAKLWRVSRAIRPNDLGLAEEKWRSRRNARPCGHQDSADEGLFARLMRDWGFSKDRLLYLFLFRDEMSEEAVAAFDGWKEEVELIE